MEIYLGLFLASNFRSSRDILKAAIHLAVYIILKPRAEIDLVLWL